MPRYYIDSDDGDMRVDDAEGYELANANVARELAKNALPDMAHDLVSSSRDHRQDCSVTVRSETGAEIYQATLSFSERWIAKPSR